MSIQITGGYITRRNTKNFAFGHGRLRGSVLGPDETPKVKRVTVLLELGIMPGNLRHAPLQAIDAVWSSADGTWTVNELDMTRRYTAQAFDHTGQYDPVTKAGLIPEPMED